MSPHSPFAGPLYASTSSSSSLDLSLPHAKAHGRKIGKGHVRSMVASFERDRSPSFSGSEDGDAEVQRQGIPPYPDPADLTLMTPPRLIQRKERNTDQELDVEGEIEEPSIEALLSPIANGRSDDTPTSVQRAVGAQAWAEIDSGLCAIATIKRVVSTGSSSADSNAPYVEDVFGYADDESISVVEAGGGLDRLKNGGIMPDITENLDKAVQVSSEPLDTSEHRPTHRDIGVGADADVQRLFLEDELCAMRALVDSLRARLEVVEQKVVEMESETRIRSDVKEESNADETSQAAARQLNGGAVERTSNMLVSKLLAYFYPVPVSDAIRTGDPPAHADTLLPPRVRSVPMFLLLVGIGVCSVVFNHVVRRTGRR
jgi:hypothetical protein